jgi:hypothetical protein
VAGETRQRRRRRGGAAGGGPREREALERRTVVALAEVQAKPVRWLWPGRVPLGKLTVLDGDPGVGKSAVALDLAARVSRGEELPDGASGDLGGPTAVVLLAAEDGLADTVRPRLEAAGADLGRVVAMTGIAGADGPRPVVLPRDWLEVARVVARARARLLVVDPLMGYLDRRVNAYRDQDARQALAPLVVLADGVGAAVVVVRHLTKAAEVNALYRGGGSIGIIGVARSGLLAASDPDDPSGERRVLAVTKGNLAGQVPALGYRLESMGGPGRVRVAWLGPVEWDAGALVGRRRSEEQGAREALAEARRFLEAALAEGARPAREVVAAAREAGIAERKVRRAREALGVVVERDAFGAAGTWWWRLQGDAREIEMPR